MKSPAYLFQKKFWLQGLLMGGLALFSMTCATSPSGRRQLTLFSQEAMRDLGQKSFEKMKQEQTLSENLEINQYVQCVTNALTAGLDPEWQNGWEVVVFQEDSANAFALPGRRIGVHTGLLEVAKTPDQLAAVISHEISHVQARHGNERMSQQMAAQLGLAVAAVSVDSETPSGRATLAALGLGTQYGVLLPFSRTHESEADQLGLHLMAQAGFDPTQSIVLWQNMSDQNNAQPPEWMSSHPSHASRINDLKTALPEALGVQIQDKESKCVPPALTG